MMNNMINGSIASIEQMTDIIGKNNSKNNVEKTYEGKTFADIYNQKRSIEEVISDSDITSGQLKFSKHAASRLSTRNIELSDNQVMRLQDGCQKANEKGIKDSLVIVDKLAFIVNIPSSTVVTAMDQSETNNNIFTNIDGAVIV